MPGDELREHLALLKAQREAELEAQAESSLAANWERHYAELDLPKQAWADLLSRESWHWFLTLTFNPAAERTNAGIHPEKAHKAFRLFISSINRQLWGPNWHKRSAADGGLVWALGEEMHKSGRIHFHALAACARADLNQVGPKRLDAMRLWDKGLRFGHARIEPPSSQADVCGYVSKYVVKDGNVELSANFGRVRPPSIFAPQQGQPSPDTEHQAASGTASSPGRSRSPPDGGG